MWDIQRIPDLERQCIDGAVQIPTGFSEFSDLFQGLRFPDPGRDLVFIGDQVDGALDKVLPVGVVGDLPHQRARYAQAILEARLAHAHVEAIAEVCPGRGGKHKRILPQVLHQQLRYAVLQPIQLRVAGFIVKKEHRHAPAEGLAGNIVGFLHAFLVADRHHAGGCAEVLAAKYSDQQSERHDDIDGYAHFLSRRGSILAGPPACPGDQDDGGNQ